MRLCLRTAATNRPIFHPQVIMESHGGDDAGWGNSCLVHQSSLAIQPAESSVSKEEEWTKE
jgi:hypothetical protein